MRDVLQELSLFLHQRLWGCGGSRKGEGEGGKRPVGALLTHRSSDCYWSRLLGELWPKAEFRRGNQFWVQIRLGSAAQVWDTAGRQRRQHSREQAWGSHGSSKGPVKKPREDGLSNIIAALCFQKQTASVGKPGSSRNGMMDGVCIYRKGTGRSLQPGSSRIDMWMEYVFTERVLGGARSLDWKRAG